MVEKIKISRPENVSKSQGTIGFSDKKMRIIMGKNPQFPEFIDAKWEKSSTKNARKRGEISEKTKKSQSHAGQKL
jgi:hypothetical protein